MNFITARIIDDLHEEDCQVHEEVLDWMRGKTLVFRRVEESDWMAISEKVIVTDDDDVYPVAEWHYGLEWLTDVAEFVPEQDIYHMIDFTYYWSRRDEHEIHPLS